MCATCPFRRGSPYAHLAAYLAREALKNSSRICHLTGSNAITHRSGIKPHLCRGARDLQLKFFAALKVIAEPTDEAWNSARMRQGFKPTKIANPNPKVKL